MSCSLSRWLALSGAGLATAAFAIPFAAIAQEEREVVIQRVVVEEKGEKEGKGEKEEEDDDDENKASFWIGIALDGPGDLDGLKIREVYPDSPALKAELKAGDVLVAVNDKKLERVEQLVDAVQDSKGRELKLKLVREGKEQVREVTPTKRPEEKGENKENNRYAPKPEEPGAGPGPFSGILRIERAPDAPGTAPRAPATGSGSSAYPPSAPMATPRMAIGHSQTQLPNDMEITISKKGTNPAVVVARQGDKLWKTTENELGMLPPEAQAYATRMLGKDVRARLPGPGAPGMSGAMMMQGMPGMGGMGMGGMPGMPGMPGMAPGRPIEIRMGKDGRVEAIQDGKPAPHVKVVPGGGFRMEIREGAEGKNAKKEGKSEKPAAEKEDPDKARRIRQLQEQAEQLRALLNKLREQVKEND
jgi:hypothetical protein